MGKNLQGENRQSTELVGTPGFEPGTSMHPKHSGVWKRYTANGVLLLLLAQFWGVCFRTQRLTSLARLMGQSLAEGNS